MTKTGILETLSYPQRKVKFENVWLNVSPFLNLEELKFGSKYTAELTLDSKGGWYVTEFKDESPK